MKKIIFILLLVVIFPLNVKGYCETEDKIRYANLASNITTSYDYKEGNDSVSFNITIHNVHKDLVIVDKQTGKSYSNKKNTLNNFVISDLKDGASYSFDVTTDNSNCSYRTYNTLYVTVPKYNKYYKDSVCNGASEYLYCQKWVEIGNISYKEFVKLVNDYKTKSDNKVIKEENEEKNFWYIIGDFWAKYYLYIAGSIILICVPIIIIKNRKNRFDF